MIWTEPMTREHRNEMLRTLRMRGTIPGVSVSNDLDIDIFVHCRLENGMDESSIHKPSLQTHPFYYQSAKQLIIGIDATQNTYRGVCRLESHVFVLPQSRCLSWHPL